MGKSPAKWIKAVLFRKKSSRSHPTKERGASKTFDHKDSIGEKDTPDYSVTSPVISQPVSVSASRNDLAVGEVKLSTTTTDGAIFQSYSNGVVKQGTVQSAVSDTAENIKLEQAAITAQAAFRGYLARRAFRALQGIIMLQAVITGHLVRRQAVATLHCTKGIVKLQLLVRGRKLGLSDSTLSSGKSLDAKQSNFLKPNNSSSKMKSSSNAFVCKLFSSKTIVLPLQIQYVQEEPNSADKWLERWTCSRFWKPPPQQKLIPGLKSQPRSGGYAMETESARTKRIARRTSANTDPVGINNPSKPNFKKVNSSYTKPAEEHPQSELEKVKQNLRRISSSVLRPSDEVGIETEISTHNVKRPSKMAPHIPESGLTSSAEKTKSNGALGPNGLEMVNNKTNYSVAMIESQMAPKLAPETELPDGVVQEPYFETHSDDTVRETDTKEAARDAELTPLTNSNFAELCPPDGLVKDKSHALLNVGKQINEEQPSRENKKRIKRRVSLSAKPDSQENSAPNTPSLPSYMAATESAKAKLRGQCSPRLSSEGTETNGHTRRHSLPSVTNGKQRLIQTIGGGIKNDISLSASRDGHDKPIQVEWRR